MVLRLAFLSSLLFACSLPLDTASTQQANESTGSLRTSQGVLEVRYDGEWRGVCDDSFDENAAVVACRQLGGELVEFETGVNGPSSNFWLDDVTCDGTEEALALCSHRDWGSEDCSNSEHVRLICTSGENEGLGALRTLNGILEVQYNGEWRGVCDDSFEQADAIVACRQLGGELVEFKTGVNGPSSDFWLDNLGCNGDEASLLLCDKNDWGSEDCSSSEHVQLVCTSSENEGLGALRTSNGVLEVQYNGEWRGVCDDNFEQADATVVCRQLGGELVEFETGVTGPSANFWVDNLNCDGDESSILVCDRNDWGSEDCSASEHVRIVCTSGSNEGLGGLRTSNGILEVQYNGQWRGVCDDNFDQAEAAVACRQLGGELVEFDTGVSGPSSDFWLDNLDCNGDEGSLLLCDRNDWGSEDCGSSEHVRLVCTSGENEGLGALRTTNGVLEVQYNGEWRGVCDDNFEQPDAEVACRQMGGILIEFETGVSGPSSDFWLDNLGCTGDESSLLLCDRNDWGSEDCGAGEHVRLTCVTQ